MAFTKLRLRWGTTDNDVVTLSLNQMNWVSPYFVKSIVGLEPADINLSIATKAEEGGVLQGSKASNRELVILLGFQPEYAAGQTIPSLRQKLYGMLRPKLNKSIAIFLLNDDETEVWSTSGYVKTMQPNIFSKDPELQITIECLSPYFNGNTFTHPNPASLSGKSSFQITNVGSAPSGFIIDVTLTIANYSFELFNEDLTKWLIITYPLGIGDRIIINTMAGQRSLTMIRNGVSMNMLQYMSPNSSWLQVDYGVNTFCPKFPGYSVNNWQHLARYWGI